MRKSIETLDLKRGSETMEIAERSVSKVMDRVGQDPEKYKEELRKMRENF